MADIVDYTGTNPDVDLTGFKRDPVTNRIVASAGRPRGAINRPQTRDRVRIRAALAMDGDYQSLVALSKMAQENVGVAISNGDPIASSWLLERVMGKLPEAPLQVAIEGADFSNIDGVLATAAIIMEQVANGRLPLAQGEKFLSVCKSYGQLRMAEEITKIEALLKEMEDQKTRGTKQQVQVLEDDQLPRWGELSKSHVNGHDKDADSDYDAAEAALRRQLME